VKPITIDRALTDRHLLGAELGPLESWQTWLIALKGAFALPLSDAERKVFAVIAGNRNPPTRRVKEVWAIIGRRSGKSRIAAALAVFFALFVQHKLAPGERGCVLVLAATLDQAKTVFEYALAFLQASPVLRQEVVDATRSEIRLRNGIVVAIHPNSFRTIRGRTLVACIFDEVAFWRSEESATPDTEVYRAALPSMMTTGGMLISISTPYRKAGLLHQKWREHFGREGDVLVVQGASTTFNPLLTAEVIAAQRAADPEGAGAELDAEFRSDIAAFLDDATIEAATDHARPLELPPQRDYGVFYEAFVDASGGRHDHYTVAIAHKPISTGRFVVDLVRGRAPPFDPGEVTKEFAALCREYRCRQIVGDAYGAEWTETAWRSNGLVYVRSDLAKSDIYLEVLPLFTRGLVSLPAHPKLLHELRQLERQVHRGGRDSVDHPRGGSDDYANSVCGVLRGLSRLLHYNIRALAGSPDEPSDPVQWRHPPSMTPGEIHRAMLMEQFGRAPGTAPWLAREAREAENKANGGT
jgi:hypothetical protein